MGKEEVEVKVEEVEEVKVEGVEEVKLEQEVESPARSYDEAVLTSNRRRQRRGQKAKKRPFPRGRKSREPGSESSVEFVSATLSPPFPPPPRLPDSPDRPSWVTGEASLPKKARLRGDFRSSIEVVPFVLPFESSIM